MKKLIMTMLIIALAICFCSCAKSEAATAVDEQILAIGEISLDSKDVLEQVENEINALEEKDRKQLDNLQAFEEAKASYSALLVEQAEKLIDEIGAVTLDSSEKIEAAQDWISNLSEEEKGKIKNIAAFDEARSNYDGLIANKVIKLIDGIGEVTLSKNKQIKKAEDAYADLTPAQQEKVTNYNVLTDARDTYDAKREAEIKKKGKAALDSLDKDYDKVEEITWYDKFPQYIDIRSYILPYIGERNGNVWMNIRYNYTGDSWIFWKKAIILVDGERYTIRPSYSDMIHDNDTEVWEYIDIEASDSDREMLQAIADSKETIVRFEGDDYHRDLTVKASDKKLIQNVLDAYEYLNS